MTRKLKIGVAFGGGGAKAICHTGILHIFEKYGIEISAVAGTSAGALVGAAVALGMKGDEIYAKQVELNTRKMVRFSTLRLFSDSLLKDENINKVVQKMLGEETRFAQLKIPFIANAVDLESGKEIVLKEGILWQAVRASMSLPLIFSPMFLDGRYLIDGGLLNNTPVDHLREMGDLDIIIGIEVGGMTSKQYIAAMIWEKYYRKPEAFKLYPGTIAKFKMNLALMSHIMLRSIDILREKVQALTFAQAKPDLIIHPKVEGISLLDVHRHKEAYDQGVLAAEEAMPRILQIIEEKKRLLMEEPKDGSLGAPL